jgi:hypothetical protein
MAAGSVFGLLRLRRRFFLFSATQILFSASVFRRNKRLLGTLADYHRHNYIVCLS